MIVGKFRFRIGLYDNGFDWRGDYVCDKKLDLKYFQIV